jgi:hypothetical protein
MSDAMTTIGPLSPEIADDAERWERELEWAENAVEYDPTNAYDVARHAAHELEHRTAHAPELRQQLAELIARANVELVRMRDAADRYREEGAAREQHYHERELLEIHVPVEDLRQPADD